LAQYCCGSSAEEVDFLQNLAVGMPARIQEMIARDGGMTRC